MGSVGNSEDPLQEDEWEARRSQVVELEEVIRIFPREESRIPMEKEVQSKYTVTCDLG